MAMRRTACFLSACLASLAASACGPRMRPVDERLAAFLPEDTVVLAGVRADEARATPLGGKLTALLTAAGNPHNLLASWDGRQWLIAAQGDGPATVGDVTLAGHPDAVRAATARQKAGGVGPRALLGRAPAGAHIWAVSNGAPMVPDLPGMDAAARLLNATSDIKASLDLRQGVRLNFEGTCLDDRNAQIVADAVRALAGVGRLDQVMQVEQSGRAVRVTGAIPEADAERLLERLTRR